MEGSKDTSEQCSSEFIKHRKLINDLSKQALDVFRDTGMTPSTLHSKLEKAKELLIETREKLYQTIVANLKDKDFGDIESSDAAIKTDEIQKIITFLKEGKK